MAGLSQAFLKEHRGKSLSTEDSLGDETGGGNDAVVPLRRCFLRLLWLQISLCHLQNGCIGPLVRNSRYLTRKATAKMRERESGMEIGFSQQNRGNEERA